MLSRIINSFVFPLSLVILLSLLAGILAYQVPVNDSVAIGWFGDHIFLNASEGLGFDKSTRGDFYTDDLTPDSPTGRSRWTRQHAKMILPNIGKGTHLVATSLILTIQGWPNDIVAQSPVFVPVQEQPIDQAQIYGGTPKNGMTQPRVTIRVNDMIIGSCVPTPEWKRYTFAIPAIAHTNADVVLEIDTSDTFTSTLRGEDPRPKGIRLAEVAIQSTMKGSIWEGNISQQAHMLMAQALSPAWRAMFLMTVVMVMLYLLLIRLVNSMHLTFLMTTIATGLSSIGLALTRIWMGIVLDVALWILVLGLLIIWHTIWLRVVRSLVRRYAQGHALNYGMVIATMFWTAYALGRSFVRARHFLVGSTFLQDMFPDSLLVVLLGAGVLLLLFIVPGHEGLPHFAQQIAQTIQKPRPALMILLILGCIWIGYETGVVYQLAYVGHADYADNAVVARNLVAGRGWVVDYVTQFYTLSHTTTRPQETWPLLQPVWIAPFLAIFGEHAWAVKIPNLICNIILYMLLFTIGTTIWDRRVGLTAAIFTLTNHLFFKLTIYTTSDLAFVVFMVGAVYTLYWATLDNVRFSWLIFSGVLTGLMMLQKPASAMIACGMGIWLIIHVLAGGRWQVADRKQDTQTHLPLPTTHLPRSVLLWALPALLLLMPYVIRNIALFNTPVYSTERYDAWVLGYRGDSEEAWNDIYRIYMPELGGAGLPDRSWILRWGFDRSLWKFQRQVEAVRDYVMPAWTGLPKPLVGTNEHWFLLSKNEYKNLISPLGAWLALAGFVAALSSRRRLLSLLFMACAPYTIFLVTYWHANEERYWLLLMPWMLLMAAWVIWSGYDRLATIANGQFQPVGLLLVMITMFTIVQPSWPIIAKKVQQEPAQWQPDLVAYQWIREHTPTDAVIMTRNPWQLNWHTNRAAVMIPNTHDRDMLFFIARHYRATHMMFDNLQRVKGDAARLLAPLIQAQQVQVGDTIDGFSLVYGSPTPTDRVLIYRFPD